MILRGRVGGEVKTYRSRFTLPAEDVAYPELGRLWAFAAIEELRAEMDYLGEKADTKQVIVDVAVEYGLVIGDTSMLVVREEVFNQLSIPRVNQKRVEKENKARTARAQKPVVAQQNRVDTKQLMFSGSRPTLPNGGGAMSPWLALAMLLFMATLKLHRIRNSSAV